MHSVILAFGLLSGLKAQANFNQTSYSKVHCELPANSQMNERTITALDLDGDGLELLPTATWAPAYKLKTWRIEVTEFGGLEIKGHLYEDNHTIGIFQLTISAFTNGRSPNSELSIKFQNDDGSKVVLPPQLFLCSFGK